MSSSVSKPDIGRSVIFNSIHGECGINGLRAVIKDVTYGYENHVTFPQGISVCIEFEDRRVTWCRVDEIT